MNDLKRSTPRAAGRPTRAGRASGKVLVLGSDTRSFLAVVRSLGRRGLEVHAGWWTDGSPALRSRYLARAHRLPPYRPADGQWKEALLALLDGERFDLAIPCSDRCLQPLEEHRDELESLCPLAIPHREAFRVAFDKIRSADLARSLGLPLPRGMVVWDRSQIDEVRSSLRFPVVVKPRSSFLLERLHRKNRVRRVERPADLEEVLRISLERNEALVQECFPAEGRGVGLGVEVLASDGEILLAFEHERVHEPPRGAGSSYRRSVPLDGEHLEAARRLMEALRWTGVAMVELRKHPGSGESVFIEINGRSRRPTAAASTRVTSSRTSTGSSRAASREARASPELWRCSRRRCATRSSCASAATPWWPTTPPRAGPSWPPWAGASRG